MKFNPFAGVQAGNWALMDGVVARARHANARKACFIGDLLGGVYISGHPSRPRTAESLVATSVPHYAKERDCIALLALEPSKQLGEEHL
jgi:hypothetical protein